MVTPIFGYPHSSFLFCTGYPKALFCIGSLIIRPSYGFNHPHSSGPARCIYLHVPTIVCIYMQFIFPCVDMCRVVYVSLNSHGRSFSSSNMLGTSRDSPNFHYVSCLYIHLLTGCSSCYNNKGDVVFPNLQRSPADATVNCLYIDSISMSPNSTMCKHAISMYCTVHLHFDTSCMSGFQYGTAYCV